MKDLTDKEILTELEKRLSQRDKQLHETTLLMKQLKQVNERLEQSERAKSTFLSNVRNEINNPFASIMGLSAKLMEGKVETGSQLRRVGRLIHTEAAKLDFALRNVFASAEIEAGVVKPYFTSFDIKDAVEQWRSSVNSSALRNEVTVVSEVTQSTAEALIFTDRSMLNLVMQNLLDNAIDQSPASSEVQLQVAQKGDGLYITVTDTGQTISPEKITEVFNRFTKMHDGTLVYNTGQGLGLCVAKAYVEALHGKLELLPGEGSGNVFQAYLPSKHEQSAPASLEDDAFLFDNAEEF